MQFAISFDEVAIDLDSSIAIIYALLKLLQVVVTDASIGKITRLILIPSDSLRIELYSSLIVA